MNNMNKVYWVCPIHRVKYKQGVQLFKSALKYEKEKEICFIYTNEEEKTDFEIYCKKKTGRTPWGLVCTMPLDGCKCPVTVKKYFGIKQLMNKADYIATIDAETIFARQFDSYELMQEVYLSPLLGNTSDAGGRKVFLQCVNELDLEDSQILRDATNNYTLYWWFNEIPVYDMKTINEFFEWLDKYDYIDKIYSCWSCFDYFVYGIWLILYKNYKIKKIDEKRDYGLVEYIGTEKKYLRVQLEEKAGTHWTSYPRRNIRNSNPNIYLFFQLDRSNNIYSWKIHLISGIKSIVKKILNK